MQSIATLLQNRTVSKATSERSLILEDFLSKLNPTRLEARLKPLTPARLGFMLSHLSKDEIKQFYNDCTHAKSFSKYFWYKLK